MRRGVGWRQTQKTCDRALDCVVRKLRPCGDPLKWLKVRRTFSRRVRLHDRKSPRQFPVLDRSAVRLRMLRYRHVNALPSTIITTAIALLDVL
jgi:hypothetical protein